MAECCGTLRPDRDRCELSDQIFIQPPSFRLFIENDQRARQRHSLSVRAIAGQGIAYVNNLKDAYSQGDLLSPQFIGIAASVHSFMMAANQR